ncbi:atypical/PIKK/PI4K protein kinase [Clavulina sp. PMI_390]|nr:atypical/PIKK/PI4K protein kinase [Clavulina sp. PMI_390]
MDTFDFNLHQMILTDLAATTASEDPASPNELASITIASRVRTRDLSDPESVSTVECNIAFAQMAVNTPPERAEETVQTLIEILRDIPCIDFPETLSWQNWALPDQLAYSTISALIYLSATYPQFRKAAIESIIAFCNSIVSQLQSASVEQAAIVIAESAPAFHGLYRAITSTPLAWSIVEWERLSSITNEFLSSETVNRLNSLLTDYISQSEEGLVRKTAFIRTIVSRYRGANRPLSGHFVVCGTMEMQWTILAQVISPPIKQSAVASTSNGILPASQSVEAQASNAAWGALMTKPCLPSVLGSQSSSARIAIQQCLVASSHCFTSLLAHSDDEDEDDLEDVQLQMYLFETLAESLKLGAVCTLALSELNTELLDRVKLVLSQDAPLVDPLLQDAALKTLTVLLLNFESLAQPMAQHLRRFVTSPIITFQFDDQVDFRPPPTLVTAAKALSLCIKLNPDADLGMSYMYSLFNYIPVAGAEQNHPPSNDGSMAETQRGLQIYPETDRVLIAVSAVSVVTQLALDLGNDEIAKLAISMLLQRLARSEPAVEAATAHNLVDLALHSTAEDLLEIARAYSQLSKIAMSASPADERQNSNVDQLKHLSSLLLPIDSVLSHLTPKDPQYSMETVNLFQDFWLLVGLFRAADPGAPFMNEWMASSLMRIAAKTPVFVTEDAQDYLSSNLEYNRVLRKDYIEHTLSSHRSALTRCLGNRANNIKHLSGAQCAFVLAVHDIEFLRAGSCLPSALPSYFVNASLNEDAHLVSCMEVAADVVIQRCKTVMAGKIVDHSLNVHLSSELRTLLVSACHRIAKVREISMRVLERLITGFPSLMCDSSVIFALLDILTLLQNASDGAHLDEYNPHHSFHSVRSGVTLSLTDSYATRRTMLTTMHDSAKRWLELAIARAPHQVQAILQNYLTDHGRLPVPFSTELGASLALHCASEFNTAQKRRVPKSTIDSWTPDRAKQFASEISSHAYFVGEAGGVRLANRIALGEMEKTAPPIVPEAEITTLKIALSQSLKDIQAKTSKMSAHDMRRLLFRCTSVLLALPMVDHELLHFLIVLPFESLTPATVTTGLEAWIWLLQERPDVEIPLMLEINFAWSSSIQQKKGMFSSSLKQLLANRQLYSTDDPYNSSVEYAPTSQEDIDRSIQGARRLLLPHTILLQGFSSILQAVRYRRAPLMRVFLRMILRSCLAFKSMSTHPLAREVRFTLLLFGFQSLRNSRLGLTAENKLRDALYECAFSWFAIRPQWSMGANRVQLEVDVKLLQELLDALQNESGRADADISSLGVGGRKATATDRRDQNRLLRVLVENEISRLLVWANPLNESTYGSDRPPWDHLITNDVWVKLVQTAWKVDPAVAVQLAERVKLSVVAQEVGRLVKSRPALVMDCPEALHFLVGDGGLSHHKAIRASSKEILMWSSVPPVLAVTYFQPNFHSDPSLLQFAHRVLEGHPVEVTFFFVPQVVQALRTDALGYVERFIFETAKISQLFCHQIIWNMKANTYKDDMAEEPDPMKPVFDRMTDMVVASLSGSGKEFYDREFAFFNEVTSISGKLKPFIKKTKPEKKAKIDEEMAKIKVDVGVYLPSNPDGVVIDIDKRSGRPLQSHAKASALACTILLAPFMATFKVRKQRVVVADNADSVLEEEYGLVSSQPITHIDVWQAAIFKVGDDCRQDVLALQAIAMFKNAFMGVGLPLYLFPYRVVATGPGMGVIDVVPNATSRDEMGRAKVNDLLGFFTAKYGHPESAAFQKARLNFIQSMAGYSVACYLLQIKDRHNGNIMIDGEGHIVHVDFGFLFDIDESPFGAVMISTSWSKWAVISHGVKFEPSSFKLNHEMVMLMGGRNSEGYQLFQRLTVKAFLAVRPHTEQLVQTVHLMLGTGLPSFKGEGTIHRLRERFAPGLTERQAADYMIGVVKNAHENVRSTVYDEFQRLQNGIPYA